MSICLLTEIIMFENKLIAIRTYKVSSNVKKLLETSKFKLLNIFKVSFFLNNRGAVITIEPLKR